MWLTMHKDVRTSPRIRRTADFLYEALVRFRPVSRSNMAAASPTSTSAAGKHDVGDAEADLLGDKADGRRRNRMPE